MAKCNLGRPDPISVWVDLVESDLAEPWAAKFAPRGGKTWRRHLKPRRPAPSYGRDTGGLLFLKKN